MIDAWDEAEAAFEAQVEHALALDQLVAIHAAELAEWTKARRAVDVALRRARRAQRNAERVGRAVSRASKLVARDVGTTVGSILKGLDEGDHRTRAA